MLFVLSVWYNIRRIVSVDVLIILINLRILFADLSN